MLKSMLLLVWPSLALGHALSDDAKLYVELGHTYDIESVALSPDAHFVVTASGGGPARLWDVKTGEEVRTFDSQGPKYATFSPDGNSVLTVEILDTFGSIHLWDVKTGVEIKTFQTSIDASVQLWDVRTGKELKSSYGLCFERFRGHFPRWMFCNGGSRENEFAMEHGDTD